MSELQSPMIDNTGNEDLLVEIESTSEHPYAQMWREHRERMAHPTVTVGEVQKHGETISAFISAVLTGLANGKYPKEVAITEELLTAVGVAIPQMSLIEKAFEIFLWINRTTAPSARIVPDGQGGWVPESNSRYDPKTGEFL